MSTDPALADRSAVDLVRLIRARAVSAVEVIEASLERVQRLNGTINAVVTLNPRALDDARAIDRQLARGEIGRAHV